MLAREKSGEDEKESARDGSREKGRVDASMADLHGDEVVSKITFSSLRLNLIEFELFSRLPLSLALSLPLSRSLDRAMSTTAVTTRPQAPPKLAPAPTAGPKRAGVLLARAIAAVLPSLSTSTTASAPWAKDDILDALYWIRQALAVVAGPLAGLTGRQGVAIFALFVTSAASAGLSFARSLGVDDEELGGMAPLLGEGLSQAVALFVLLWVVSFSATGGGIL